HSLSSERKRTEGEGNSLRHPASHSSTFGKPLAAWEAVASTDPSDDEHTLSGSPQPLSQSERGSGQTSRGSPGQQRKHPSLPDWRHEGNRPDPMMRRGFECLPLFFSLWMLCIETGVHLGVARPTCMLETHVAPDETVGGTSPTAERDGYTSGQMRPKRRNMGGHCPTSKLVLLKKETSFALFRNYNISQL